MLCVSSLLHEGSSFVWISYHSSSSVQDSDQHFTDAQLLLAEWSQSQVSWVSLWIWYPVSAKAGQGLPSEEGKGAKEGVRGAWSGIETRLQHCLLFLCLPPALFSYFSSTLSPNSPHTLQAFSCLRAEILPPGPWEMLKRTLGVSWVPVLLCRITANTGQSRKSKETANQRDVSTLKAGPRRGCAWQGCPLTAQLERWRGSLPGSFLGEKWLDPNASVWAHWLGTVGWS